MRLYYGPSPNRYKVRLALAQLGVSVAAFTPAMLTPAYQLVYVFALAFIAWLSVRLYRKAAA